MACATPSLAPDANWLVPSNFVLTPTLRPRVDPDLQPPCRFQQDKGSDEPHPASEPKQLEPKSNKRDVSPFNFYHHFQSIFSVPHGPPYLRFLDGLRVLSMLYVHLGHAFIFYLGFLPGMHAYKNAEAVRHSLPHHFILGGTFAVDTFFFLSGLLVAYQVSKALRKLSTFKSRFAATVAICLQRYVRLIGLVIVLLIFTMMQDPDWVDDPFQKEMIQFGKAGKNGSCGTFWWTVPLLITNVVHEGAAECIGWMWYLSNDYQFFILGMSLILVYTWNRNVGIISSVSILGVSLVYSVYVVLTYSIPASIDAFGFSGAEGFANGARETVLLMNEGPDNPYFFKFYVCPLVRIQAYIIGLLFGLYLAKKEKEGEFVKSGPSVICSAPRTPTLILTPTRDLPEELPSLSLSPTLAAEFSLSRPRDVSLCRGLAANEGEIGEKSENNSISHPHRDSSSTRCQSPVSPPSPVISHVQLPSLRPTFDDEEADPSCMSPMLRLAVIRASPKASSTTQPTPELSPSISPMELLSTITQSMNPSSPLLKSAPATKCPPSPTVRPSPRMKPASPPSECNSQSPTMSSSLSPIVHPSTPTLESRSPSTTRITRRRTSLSHLCLPTTAAQPAPSATSPTMRSAQPSGPRLCERKFHWGFEASVYVASIALICLPYYANIKHPVWTPIVNLFYVAWSRCLWAACIGCLSFLSVSNNLMLTPFLSSKLWIPFSKLSYAFYLVHPIIMSSIYAGNRLLLPRFLSWDVFTYYFFLTVFVTLIVALLTYIFIETPLKLIGFRILKKCLSPLEKTVKHELSAKKVD